MKDSTEHLLLDDETEMRDNDIPYRFPCATQRPRSFKAYFIALLIITTLSISLNLFLSARYLQSANEPFKAQISKFAGLASNLDVLYESTTDYSGENETLADELWESINTTSAGAVVLNHGWAASKGLIRAQDFPWDDEMGIYYIQGIHSMHCLKVIRKSVTEFKRGSEQSVVYRHIHHCLDALRRRVMCMADDLPLASKSNRKHETGKGQLQQCRDWDKLVAWGADVKRHACYAQVDEYRHATNQLERFGFCEEDSPYRPAMEAYFKVHGHKQMFD